MTKPIMPDVHSEEFTSAEQFGDACREWEEDMIVYEEWLRMQRQEEFEDEMDSLDDYIDVEEIDDDEFGEQ